MTGSIADIFVECGTNHPLSAPPAERQRFLEAARVLFRLDPMLERDTARNRKRRKEMPADTAANAEKLTAELWGCIDRVVKEMRAENSIVKDSDAWARASESDQRRWVHRIFAANTIKRHLPPRLAKGERRPIAGTVRMPVSTGDLVARLLEHLHATVLIAATNVLLQIDKDAWASKNSESGKGRWNQTRDLDLRKNALTKAAVKLRSEPGAPRRKTARARELKKRLQNRIQWHSEGALRAFADRHQIEI